MQRRVLITGAAGCGTTSLGQRVAAVLACPHLDADHFYWMPTDPPYRCKRSSLERNYLLQSILSETRDWVLSGSIDSWGLTDFECDLVVFLTADLRERIQRLKVREAIRFGARIEPPHGDLAAHHAHFLEWAAQYDSGTAPGRSRPRHETWLRGLTIPVLRLNGEDAPASLARQIIDWLGAHG